MDYAIAQDLVPEGRTFYEGKFAKTWIEGAGKYSVGARLSLQSLKKDTGMIRSLSSNRLCEGNGANSATGSMCTGTST
jgi:hypothetical protein